MELGFRTLAARFSGLQIDFWVSPGLSGFGFRDLGSRGFGFRARVQGFWVLGLGV